EARRVADDGGDPVPAPQRFRSDAPADRAAGAKECDSHVTEKAPPASRVPDCVSDASCGMQCESRRAPPTPRGIGEVSGDPWASSPSDCVIRESHKQKR